MNLVSFKPFVVSRRPAFTNGIDRVFEDFFKDFNNLGAPVKGFVKQHPAVNIVENGDAYRLELAAPGLKKNDFTINVEKNVLTVSAKKADEQKKEEESYTRREFNYFEFNRSFTLPETADLEKINAAYNEGILTVTIAKKEEAKELPARKIEIA